MNRRAALLTLAGSLPALRAESGRNAVVVELFTSEGCSSCPPADALLAQLEQRVIGGAEIIALSEHVDYWNHLGWADTFSSPLFSARQREYATRFRMESVYTPQMVIDGRAESLGSDERKVYSTIELAARFPRAYVRVDRVSSEPDDSPDSARIRVMVDKIPAAFKDESFDVMLAITQGGVSSSVARGENAGRVLRHTGVVRTLTRVAGISPKKERTYSATLMVPLPHGHSRTRAAIFVQSRDSQAIIGAAACQLSS